MMKISIEAASNQMDVPAVWVAQMIENGELTNHSQGTDAEPAIDEMEILCAGWMELPVAPYRHTNELMVHLGLRVLH